MQKYLINFGVENDKTLHWLFGLKFHELSHDVQWYLINVDFDKGGALSLLKHFHTLSHAVQCYLITADFDKGGALYSLLRYRFHNLSTDIREYLIGPNVTFENKGNALNYVLGYNFYELSHNIQWYLINLPEENFENKKKALSLVLGGSTFCKLSPTIQMYLIDLDAGDFENKEGVLNNIFKCTFYNLSPKIPENNFENKTEA